MANLVRCDQGGGEFVELKDLTVERLPGLIQKVVEDPDYRDRARSFQKAIAENHGLDVAANVVEQAFQTHQNK
jgi:zeaxanthin glucosyltransferase